MDSINVTSDYGWSSAADPGSCGYVSPRIIKLLHSLSARCVLDLGSGNGVLCGHIASAGFRVVGVEHDRSGVEVSKSAYPSINFYNLGVQDSPAELIAKEGLFDLVISTEVIEHLFSPHLLPIFASQTLTEGGHLIVTTPYHGFIKNLALSVFNKWDSHHTPLWHGGHIKFWSRATLTKLLSDNGFQVVGFSGVGRIPYLWKSMVIVAKKLIK